MLKSKDTEAVQQAYRYNQELEEDTAAMEQERLQLQQQATSLAERLDAVLSDKFVPRTDVFDSDMPIDKTLAFLQSMIEVIASFCILPLKTDV